MFIRAGYIALIAVGLFGISYSLICYKCNQREPGTEVCKNASREDCNVVFPLQASVCLKTVQRFSTGQPSWVFAQCQIRQSFSANQIDACQVSTTPGINNATDRLETCTCTLDLCNGAPEKSSFSLFSLALALLIAMVLL